MAASSSSSLRQAPSVLQGSGPGPRLRSLCVDAGGDVLAGADSAFCRQQVSPRACGEARWCGPCADFLGNSEHYAFAVLVPQRQASTQTNILVWDAQSRVGQRNWESVGRVMSRNCRMSASPRMSFLDHISSLLCGLLCKCSARRFFRTRRRGRRATQQGATALPWRSLAYSGGLLQISGLCLGVGWILGPTCFERSGG